MNPRIYSLAFLIVLSAWFVSPSLQAGASNKNGNPFGNGTFFSNDGTFSAVLRGPNLVGITQFSTYGSGTATTGLFPVQNPGTGGEFGTPANVPGTISIFFAGTNFPGVAAGVIDPASGAISSVFSMAAGAAINPAGSYNANLQNSYPNQTFSGSGVFNDGTADRPFTVNGVRVSSSALVYQ